MLAGRQHALVARFRSKWVPVAAAGMSLGGCGGGARKRPQFGAPGRSAGQGVREFRVRGEQERAGGGGMGTPSSGLRRFARPARECSSCRAGAATRRFRLGAAGREHHRGAGAERRERRVPLAVERRRDGAGRSAGGTYDAIAYGVSARRERGGGAGSLGERDQSVPLDERGRDGGAGRSVRRDLRQPLGMSAPDGTTAVGSTASAEGRWPCGGWGRARRRAWTTCRA